MTLPKCHTLHWAKLQSSKEQMYLPQSFCVHKWGQLLLVHPPRTRTVPLTGQQLALQILPSLRNRMSSALDLHRHLLTSRQCNISNLRKQITRLPAFKHCSLSKVVWRVLDQIKDQIIWAFQDLFPSLFMQSLF